MYKIQPITVGCICSFLFGNLETYSYLCKKITHTPCYKIVKIMESLIILICCAVILILFKLITGKDV